MLGLKKRIGKKLVGKGFGMIGSAAIIQDEDGTFTVAEKQWDPANSGYWVNGREEFYPCDYPIGGSLGGGHVAVGYHGIGRFMELPSAKLVEDVEQQLEDGRYASVLKKRLDKYRAKPGDSVDANRDVAGEEGFVAAAPSWGMVSLKDLRKINTACDSPERYSRIEKNAVASALGSNVKLILVAVVFLILGWLISSGLLGQAAGSAASGAGSAVGGMLPI